ncbi:trehalose synthase complex regulatory subunit [Pseudozyma hubeiensis SY62]|uniref:Trehalose synthase complex regulatory subunit n=1 Tax=Pseudozyma hubeiensis (strain SY62) TaxID=1305764 RepID=R9PDW4_PSEHS|nr:trehalose synthase complex regulatory subunit [Pseudozyma hubeiensis SY62]GAC99546.1 trehalose synthase complex regulatory subunit [Pseudozyma hubeiensis SY62]
MPLSETATTSNRSVYSVDPKASLGLKSLTVRKSRTADEIFLAASFSFFWFWLFKLRTVLRCLQIRMTLTKCVEGSQTWSTQRVAQNWLPGCSALLLLLLLLLLAEFWAEPTADPEKRETCVENGGLGKWSCNWISWIVVCWSRLDCNTFRLPSDQSLDTSNCGNLR